MSARAPAAGECPPALPAKFLRGAAAVRALRDGAPRAPAAPVPQPVPGPLSERDSLRVGWVRRCPDGSDHPVPGAGRGTGAGRSSRGAVVSSPRCPGSARGLLSPEGKWGQKPVGAAAGAGGCGAGGDPLRRGTSPGGEGSPPRVRGHPGPQSGAAGSEVPSGTEGCSGSASLRAADGGCPWSSGSRGWPGAQGCPRCSAGNPPPCWKPVQVAWLWPWAAAGPRCTGGFSVAAWPGASSSLSLLRGTFRHRGCSEPRDPASLPGFAVCCRGAAARRGSPQSRRHHTGVPQPLHPQLCWSGAQHQPTFKEGWGRFRQSWAGDGQDCKVTVARGGGDMRLYHTLFCGPPTACPPGVSGWGRGCCGVSLSAGTSPTAGSHPLQGCHPLQGYHPLRSPAAKSPCAVAAAGCCRTPRLLLCSSKKLQSWSGGSGLLRVEVLLQRCHSWARRAEAQPPAGAVSRLLHYSSLAQRLGRTLPGAARAPAAPWGWPLLCAFAALGCFWLRGVSAKQRGSGWAVCRGSVGHRGGDAPKVIEASGDSGMSPVLLGQSTILQNTLPPPRPSRGDAPSLSCTW